MKKIISVILAILMLMSAALFVVSCGSKDETKSGIKTDVTYQYKSIDITTDPENETIVQMLNSVLATTLTPDIQFTVYADKITTKTGENGQENEIKYTADGNKLILDSSAMSEIMDAGAAFASLDQAPNTECYILQETNSAKMVLQLENSGIKYIITLNFDEK